MEKCQKYQCDHHSDVNLCWDIVSLANKILTGKFCSTQVTVAHILAILTDWCIGGGLFDYSVSAGPFF